MKATIVKETAPFFIGSAGLTFPLWVEAIATGWQFLIAFVGGLVVLMTFYNKFLEIQQRRRDLRK
ncbi:MAG: hypothetical protein AAFR98_11860 [Pseudomonadota bacterium]